MKDNTVARLYSLLFMLIRIAFVLVLVIGEKLSVKIKVIEMAVLQFLFVIYLVSVRSFSSIKDMVVEIVNQVLFLTLTILLVHFNIQEEWSNIFQK